jgi:hypothetical protein
MGLNRETVGQLRARWGTYSGGLLSDGSFPKYTSFGCYTLRYYVGAEYAAMCGPCAGKEHDDEPIAVETYDEGEPFECEGCGALIESSYGPVSE